MRDGIVPFVSDGKGGMDCRVRVGTEALRFDDCLCGILCRSDGDSYVEVDPDRTDRGGLCHEAAESCDNRREWLERGERRDELEARVVNGCRDEPEVEVESPEVTEECEFCRLLTGKWRDDPVSGDLVPV